MKHLIFCLIVAAHLSNAFAGTCTATTRTNYSPNSVLTSSALNGDFNQLVTKLNSFDGGCTTDGTLEASALNSSDFAVPLNAIKNGCVVSRSDANTVSVDKCYLSVNGSFVRTTVPTTVTWGCTSCSPETATTTYYVYAKNGSSGSTLNLLLLTSAPNNDEYDGSGNRALGKIFNNESGDFSYVVWNYVNGNLVSNEVTRSGYFASAGLGPFTHTVTSNEKFVDSVTATTYLGYPAYKVNYSAGAWANGAYRVCTGSSATGEMPYFYPSTSSSYDIAIASDAGGTTSTPNASFNFICHGVK